MTTWPSFVSVAPMTADAAATGPPQTSGSSVQPAPLAGAVNVLTPPLELEEEWPPVANRRSVLSGMTSRASPFFAPSQLLVTVVVPSFAPPGEKRVSKIELGAWLPRFQIACNVPVDVRARPS